MTIKLEGWFCATMKLRCELWWFWASMTLNMKYNIEFRTLKSINRNDDIVSRWPLDTKNDGIVPHEIELMVLWLVWNWINAIVTHSKLNWRYCGLYEIELTALWFLRNWIDSIVSYMKFVAYIKLNWRYCDSFEIELTVIMWWNRATFKYCVQMFDFGWANFYFEFWKHK
jgi:hypothetical protein